MSARKVGGTISYAVSGGPGILEEDVREGRTHLTKRAGVVSYVADSRRPKAVLMQFVRTELVTLEDEFGNRRTETIQTPMEATFVLEDLREARR